MTSDPRVVPEPAAEPVDLMAALRRSIEVAREERLKRNVPTPAEEPEPVDD